MKKLVLLSALVFGMVFYSCSSDDDDNVVAETITLQGDWQLTHVDFTVMTEGGIPTSDSCIMEVISGYRFFADKSFFFILKAGTPLPTQGDYWTWEGDISDFKIVQPNPYSPPYNFSVTPIDLEVNTVNGKTTMTFQSEMGNGSKAHFTLIKEEIDQTKLPVLTNPEGELYHCGYFG